MINQVKVSVTTTGGAGASAGNTDSDIINGRVIGIYVDYNGAPATTDVVIKATTVPEETILTLTNKNTDGWFHPQRLLDDNQGVDLTAIYGDYHVAGRVNVAVAESNDGTIDVYIKYEK